MSTQIAAGLFIALAAINVCLDLLRGNTDYASPAPHVERVEP